ncbi:hypothetical protein A2U01_0075711, partial [Trifolium medium]|nr:hypothetical protein [Trifolium medium]
MMGVQECPEMETFPEG